MNPISVAGSGIRHVLAPTFQTPATLDQAAPVQNTWYTVLNSTANCRVISVTGAVRDTGETVQIRITIDTIVLTASAALVANTDQEIAFKYPQGALGIDFVALGAGAQSRAFLLEGKSVKIEIRKTTAAGNGNLQSVVNYQKW